MLTHLRIRNFAILDDVEMELAPGLTVLTGETGAGKSLIAQAVALLRGGRASAQVIRRGSSEAQVEALFDLSHHTELRHQLAEADIPAEEGLLVRRIVSRRGRGRVYLGGTLATASQLAEIVGGLIDLTSQHEHQTLCEPQTHLAVLDASGRLEARVEQVAEAYRALRASADALAQIAADEQARGEREDFLRFQLKELDSANIQPHEERDLSAERDRLRSADRLRHAAHAGESSLYSREGAVCDEIAGVVRQLDPLTALDPALTPLRDELQGALVVCQEVARELGRYADRVEANPGRLAQVEDRLAAINRLVRKHGPTLEAVLARHTELRAELDALVSVEARREEAQRSLEDLRAGAQQAAASLTRAREKAAADLGRHATKAIRELGMRDALVTVQVVPRPPTAADPPSLCFDGHRLGPRGWDRAELLLAANPGEEPQPLARVASGGELSRVMLGLRQVLAGADAVGTYIFDEVDAGIGGEVAEVLGRQLHRVARVRQTVCITHLAPVAAAADTHLLVEKRVGRGRAQTRVRKLGGDERVAELARMLGGQPKTAKAHAHELLRGAGGTARRRREIASS